MGLVYVLSRYNAFPFRRFPSTEFKPIYLYIIDSGFTYNKTYPCTNVMLKVGCITGTMVAHFNYCNCSICNRNKNISIKVNIKITTATLRKYIFTLWTTSISTFISSEGMKAYMPLKIPVTTHSYYNTRSYGKLNQPKHLIFNNHSILICRLFIVFDLVHFVPVISVSLFINFKARKLLTTDVIV